jgi:spoIIIJ-associated protein
MPSHKKNEFEGKDIADAISKACKSLNLSQEKLDIEVLTTGTSGIFGLCRQKARLRVTVKGEHRSKVEEKPKKKAAKPKTDKAKPVEKKKRAEAREKKKESKPEPSQKVEDKKPPQKDIQLGAELLAQVETDLGRVLELMSFPSEVTVSSDQENVTAMIKGDYDDEIVDQNGKILDSLQYLLRKMVGKKFSEKAIISLDAGDFRAKRNEELKQLGLEFAEEVKKNGKTKSIPSLNPSERRVVHLALQDDKEIRSRSVGEGLFKKVLIYRPGKGRKGSSRRRKKGGGNRNKKQ